MKKRALVVGRVVPVLLALVVFGLTPRQPHAVVSNITSVWTSTETDGTNFVSMGDLDGDGDPDMAVCGGGSATPEPMRVYSNDGGNTFTLLWSSTENLKCWEVKMGDSDNDGDLDLLTANDVSTPNRLYTNDGAGSFTLAWSDTDNDSTSSVAWGDYDRDGDLDFWAGNQSGVPDRLYRNDGGNVFTVAFTSPDTDNTDALAWGDTDGDGDLDMLVGNTGVARTLYRNDGADTFTSVWSSTEVDNLSGVALGDMDDDGDLDLVTSGYNVNTRVYAGDGANGFALTWSSPGAMFGQNVALGDINGDGMKDIVVAVEAAANELFTNGGSMSFNSNWTSADTDSTISIALADTDGDGDMDIFAGNRNQANRVYVNGDNPANTAPSAPTLIPVGGGVSGSVPLMWAGDSIDDHTPNGSITYNLRVGTFSGGNDVMSGVVGAGPGNVGQALSHALVLSAGAGSQNYYWSVQAVDTTGFLTSSFATEGFFTVSGAPPPNAYSLSFTSSEVDTAQAMSVADLDNDGDNDVVLAVSGAAKRVYSNDGAFAFTAAWTSAETNDSNHVDVGDYDNDGLLDLLFGNGTGQADQLYHNNGGLAFSLAWTSTVAANTNGVKLADMNNDGYLDVVSADDTDLNIYYGDGQGGFSAASQVITGGTAHKGLAVGDVSGDGRLDIVLADNGGTRRAYLNNGSGSFGLNWTSSETEQNEGLRLGDYDGDGDLDLLASVPTGNNRLYQNDGTGTFTSVWTSPNVFDYRNADFADFNADGALDLAQVANVGGAVEVFSNAGMDNFIQDWASAETGEFYAVAFADMDGDNDVDLVAKATGEPLYVYENTLNPPNTPPSMLSLTAEPDGVSGSVTLDWSPATDDLTPPGQLTYNLRVGTTPGGSEIVSPASAAGPGNVGQAVTHTLNLSDGGGTVTYYWSVQAVDTVGYARSTFLAEDSFTLGGGGGDTTGPTGGAISYTGGVTNAASVALTLTPATDTSGMGASAFILRADALYDGFTCGNFAPATQLAEISSTDTLYTDTTIAPGMCYQYQYKALDTLTNFTLFTSVAVVQVDPGMSDSQPLAAPTNFAVGSVLTSSAVLSWDAVQDAVAYGVSVVNVATQAEVVSTSVTAPTTSYTATGLSPGVSYSALVVALDANTAPGLPPTPVDFATQAAPQQLAAPANLSVNNVLTSSVVLSWDAVQNAVAYGVSVVDVATSAVVVSTSVTAPTTTYNAAGLTHNTSYSVVITAIDANNAAGTPSAALLFHTLEQNWASVSNITYNSVTVHWQNITTVPGGQFVGFLLSPPLSRNPDGLYFVASTGDASDLSHNLTGLAPETQYTVLVFAVTDSNSARNQQYLSVSQTVVFTTLAAPTPYSLAWSSTEADNTWDIVLGDYDGDGDLDQLVGNQGQSNRVYRNDGGNTFTLAWSSAEADQTKSTSWGDYDGDGDLDQLVGNFGGANRVYRNDGGNTFSLAWSSAEMDSTTFVAWGDSDGDGDLDQLVGNVGQANRVYRNDGNNTFTRVWSSAEADATQYITWGDYDGDGDLDQFVGNSGQANRAYRNDGANTFTLAWSSTETDITIGIALGDYDGDGDLDQLVGNFGATSQGQPNRVYRNDGNSTFTLAWSSTENDSTNQVGWGDYDGDGDLDQLVANYSGAPHRVYRNDGNSTFTLAWSSVETDSARALALGDTDGDGDLDMLMGRINQPNRVYRNDLNPANTPPTAPTLTAEPDVTATGDTTSVTLAWAAASDVQTPPGLLTYNLRVGTTPGGNQIKSAVIGAGPGNVGQRLSHTLTLPVTSTATPYYWSVHAVDNTGFAKSAFAAEDSFTVTGPLPAPGTLTLESINGASVNLSWTPVAAAVSYHIHIDSSGTPPEPDFTVNAPTTTLTVPCLWAGTGYSAFLSYTDAGGTKHTGVSSVSINMPSRSGNTLCPLEAPKNLVAGAVTERSAALSWRSVYLANEYRVEKKLSSATDWESPTTVEATEFALTCLEAGAAYDFRVSAVDQNGTAGDPAQISQTMLPTAANNRGCPTEPPTPTQAQVSLNLNFPSLVSPVLHPCENGGCVSIADSVSEIIIASTPRLTIVLPLRASSQAQALSPITVKRPGPEGGLVPVFFNVEEGTYDLRVESRDTAGAVVGVAVTTVNAEAGTQVVPTLVSGVEYTGAGFSPTALSLRTGESLVIRNSGEATGAFAVAGLAGCEATLAPTGVLACTVRQAGDFTITGPGPNFTAQVTVTQDADSLSQARPSLGVERSAGATNTGAFTTNLLVNNGGAGLPVGAAIDPGNGEDALPVSAEGPVSVTYAPGSYTALLLDANKDVLGRLSVTVAEGEPVPEPPAASGEVVAGFEEVQLGLVTPGTYTVQGVQTVSVSGSGPIYNVAMPALDDFYLESELDDGNNDGATKHTFPIVIEPTTIPTLNGGETRSILFKVRVPIGTPPGNYRAGKGVVSDNNNNQQFDPGDSYDIFQVKLTVADFAAQGATCPAHELLQVGDNISETPLQPDSASRNAAWEVTP